MSSYSISHGRLQYKDTKPFVEILAKLYDSGLLEDDYLCGQHGEPVSRAVNLHEKSLYIPKAKYRNLPDAHDLFAGKATGWLVGASIDGVPEGWLYVDGGLSKHQPDLTAYFKEAPPAYKQTPAHQDELAERWVALNALEKPSEDAEESEIELLYRHRAVLFIALMLSHQKKCWTSPSDAYGKLPRGTVLAGLSLPVGDVAFHIKEPDSVLFDYLDLPHKQEPPHYDGYTQKEGLDRLVRWVSAGCP